MYYYYYIKKKLYITFTLVFMSEYVFFKKIDFKLKEKKVVRVV